MECLFCQIIDGAQPATVVLDEPFTLGFLDTRPLFRGHVLLVPKIHVDTFADLPAELLPVLMGAAQRVSAAVVTGLGAQGSFVAVNNVVSQSVPHLHVHVVPRTKGDGLRGFFWPRTKYATEDEAGEYAAKLAAAIPAPPA